MRPCLRHKPFLDFIACFAIPAYTLLLVDTEHWFSTNFSATAMTAQARFAAFSLWAALLGSYFALALSGVCRTLPRPSRPYGLVLAACLAFTATVILPYRPRHSPRAARAHVLMSFGASLLILAAILLVLLQCRCGNKARYNRCLYAWLALVLVSAGLLWSLGKVTGVLEVWFVITATLLVRALWLSRLE